MTEANIGHRLAQAASCPPPPDLHIVGEGEVHHLDQETQINLNF